MMTVPESEETMETQLRWLQEGKRKAVLIPHGTPFPHLPAYSMVERVPEGLLVFFGTALEDVRRFNARQVTLAQLLGYGIDAKPEPADEIGCVTIRGRNGHEKQAVVTDAKRLDPVTAAAEAVKDPGDTVQLEPAAQVVADRLRSLDAKELRVRPFVAERDALALAAAAQADQHRPLSPTHVIERGEEIVGYFGINSLPLYRLWFHSEKLKASDSTRLLFMIENHYRMAGVGMVATVCNTRSPFYPVAARLGYLEAAGDRLFLKGL
jgi:hypothetical protein